MFIVFASKGGFGTLFTDDSELFYETVSVSKCGTSEVANKIWDIPGESTVRQCSSPLSAGYDILDEVEELKRDPKNGMGIEDLRSAGLVD